MKMQNSVQITLIIVVGVLILSGIIITSISNFTGVSNTVSGQGVASIKAMPDLAVVYFNVQTKGDTSKEANDANTKIVGMLIQNLIEEGFVREEIQTEGFNIYQDFDWVNGKRIDKGFVASHQIKVELETDEFEKIGNVIDAGVNAGASINYINFELSQEQQNHYKAEAIKMASEDAKLKAEAMAEGLDKELGKLVSVSDSSFDYSPWLAYRADSAVEVGAVKEAVAEIQPSEREITARVTAVFKIR